MISVKWPPMMSSPTNNKPRSRRVGPTASAISRSRSDMGIVTPLPPAAKLPRVSPWDGIRARTCGIGLPCSTRTRRSPSTISGRYSCAITSRDSFGERVSRTAPRFKPSAVIRKIPEPPMPSSGLRMMSPCVFWNARMSSCFDETTVFGIKALNSVANSFSLQSRIACGSLTT